MQKKYLSKTQNKAALLSAYRKFLKEKKNPKNENNIPHAVLTDDTAYIRKNRQQRSEGKKIPKDFKDFTDDEIKRLEINPINDKELKRLKNILKTLTPELFQRWVELSEELIEQSKIDIDTLKKMSTKEVGDIIGKSMLASLNKGSLVDGTEYENYNKYVDEQRILLFKKYSLTSFKQATPEILQEWEKIKKKFWELD